MFAFLVFANSAQALSPRDYTFQLSPATRELTQQSVRGVFQDSRGFIWVLTQEGLHKYDGYTVTRFRASNRDPKSISHQSTTDIVEDKSGYLWISTAGGGLNKFNPNNNTFSAIQAAQQPSSDRPLSNNIYSMFKDTKGFIWLAYETGIGFSRYSPTTGIFDHFPPEPSAKHTRAVSFAETEDGAIWILVDGLGLLQLGESRNLEDVVSVPLDTGTAISTTRFSHLMASKDGALWISSLDAGITKYEPQSRRFQHFTNHSDDKKAISDNSVYMSIEDQSKNVWVATRSGVSVWEPETETFTWINSSNSNIPDDQVFSIYQSKAGIVWIGTFNGLAYGTRSLFARIDSVSGPGSDSINAFAEDRNGVMWIGTNSGIHTFDPKSAPSDHFLPAPNINDRLSSPLVMSLLVEEDAIWIGTLDSGLNRYDIDTGEVELFKKRVSVENSLKADGITSILRTTDGDLLVGTYGGGLSVLSPDSSSFTTYTVDPKVAASISSNNVIAIFEDSSGDVWVGTENGLNLFNKSLGNFTVFKSTFQNPESLSSNMTWALHEDYEGRLWIGTQSGGLNVWSPEDRRDRVNRFTQYLENIDLPSADIYAITSDDDGNIWMSHNRGISRFSIEDESTENFDISDGLQGTEFNHGAVFRSGSADLYFGGNAGFNIIDPRDLRKNVYLPPIQITEFRILNEEIVFDEPVADHRTIELDHDFRYASFTFASLDYTNPASNLYRYKLDGFDDEWIELGNQRSVSFTSLPAGNYEFLLQGSNSDGVWNPKTLAFHLNVSPAPWLSPVAYFFYVVAVLGAIAAIAAQQHAKSALAIARQRELENKVQERTIDLEEARNTAERANRAKTDFLATVTHEIRTPLHGIIGMTELLQHTRLSEEQRKYTIAAHSSGESLLELINSILDLSKIEAEKIDLESISFDLVKILDEVSYIQSEAASRKNISIYYYIDPAIPDYVMGDPTKIKQVVTNLFSNAIKFTGEGSVTLKASWVTGTESLLNSDELTIEVADTGIGIEANAKDRLFEAFTQADASTTRKYGGTGLGLAISKNFVDLMRGTIRVDSTPGAGTVFTVTIPLERAPNSDDVTGTNQTSSLTLLSNNERLIDSSLGHAQRARKIVNICRTKTEAMSQAETTSGIVIDVDALPSKTELMEFLSAPSLRKKYLLCSFRFETEPYRSLLDGVITKPISTTALIEFTERETDLIQNTPKAVSTRTMEPTRNAKVLIAEDLETNQKIAKAVFEMYGCTVAVANNGQEAFEKFKQSRYDAIFMDCQMPIMDGYEATSMIRKHEKKYNLPRTPVVALTAGNSSDEMRRGLAAGMDQYLTKPFKMDEIRIALVTHGIHVSPAHADSFDSNDIADTSESPYRAIKTLNMEAIGNIFAVEKQTGGGLLDKLVDGYREQMTEKLQILAAAAHQDDLKILHSSAHAIKSMSSNIGAEKVRLISAGIEKNAKVGVLTNLARDIADLELANNEFLTAISELLNPD